MTAAILNSQFFILNFLAMGSPPQPGEPPIKSSLMIVGQMLLIFGVFYLILIRPHQKQQKELKKLVDSLKVSDRILTTGGIFGVISQVKEKSVVVKIAEGTKVEMLRSGIQQVLPREDKDEKKD